jgi:hypothetical protein
MQKTLRLIFLTSILFATAAFADTQQEINHLLEFVANTTCQYERNGTLYNGKKAQDHINRKYEYFQDEINSAEDFIAYSATKSTMSGKHYQVHCPGLEIQDSSDWLLEELQNYRTNKASSNG